MEDKFVEIEAYLIIIKDIKKLIKKINNNKKLNHNEIVLKMYLKEYIREWIKNN